MKEEAETQTFGGFIPSHTCTSLQNQKVNPIKKQEECLDWSVVWLRDSFILSFNKFILNIYFI